MYKKIISLSLTIVTCFLLASCKSEVVESQKVAGYSYETLQLDGKKVTQHLSKSPEKVLVIGEKNAERMSYFGLEDKIAGLAYLESANEKDIKYPVISKEWTSKESVIQLKPDLIYGISTVFQDDRLGDFSFWNKQNIAVGTTSNYTTGISPEAFHGEIEEFGQIFNITEKTTKFINNQKEEIETIIKESKGKLSEESILFIASDGRGNYYYYPANYHLVDDITHDLDANYLDLGEELITLSPETLIKLNPEKIIFTKFMAIDEKDSWLENPALNKVSAIQNKEILTLSYDDVIRGNENLSRSYKNISEFLKADKND